MSGEAQLADGYFRDQEKRFSEERKQERERGAGGLAEKREFSEHLDVDLVEGLIFEHDGNVSDVAKALHVRSDRLRSFIMASGQLRRALDEVYEGAVDEAIGVLFAGLRDSVSFQNRFYAAKEFLRSTAGRKRGFGQVQAAQAAIEVKDSASGRTIVLKWLEPDPPKLIEGEKA